MQRLYYYSKSEVRFKEVCVPQLILGVATCIIVISFLIVTAAHFGVDPMHFKDFQDGSISGENAVLKARLASFGGRLDYFDNVMNRLASSNNLLRTVVDLPPIPKGVREVGIGGVKENADYGISSTGNNLIASATTDLSRLYRDARLQMKSYSAVKHQYKINQKLFAHIPAIDPVATDLITSPFGIRFHPILHVYMMHEGIDLGVDVGTPVHATGDGVVSYAGRDGGYGNAVVIDNGFSYSTLFGHLERLLVKVGQRVKRGQVIALSGDTGLSTGPHLHYEVRIDGVHVNPTGYFFAGSQYLSTKFFSELAGR